MPFEDLYSALTRRRKTPEEEAQDAFSQNQLTNPAGSPFGPGGPAGSMRDMTDLPPEQPAWLPRSSTDFGGMSRNPQYSPNQKPQLFDLNAAMMMQQNPAPRHPLDYNSTPTEDQLLAANGPDALAKMRAKFIPLEDRQPQSVGNYDLNLAGLLGAGPTPVAPTNPLSSGQPILGNGGQLQSNAVPTPQPNTVRTFTGRDGVSSYDMGPNYSKYLGSGDVNGQKFATVAEEARARAKDAMIRGQQETGVAGVPAVSHLEQSLLGGLNMSPEHKREMALGIQGQLMKEASQQNVAKLAHQHNMAAKSQDMQDAMWSKLTAPLALGGGGLSSAEAMKHIKALPSNQNSANGLTSPTPLPGVTPIVPLTPKQQETQDAKDAIKAADEQRVQSHFSDAATTANAAPGVGVTTKTPYKPNPQGLIDAVNASSDENRDAMKDLAARLAAQQPGMLEAMVPYTAGLSSHLGWDKILDPQTRKLLPADRLGTNFDLRSNTNWYDVGRIANANLGKPEAFYNEAVMPDKTIIPIKQSDLYGGTAQWLRSDAEKQKISKDLQTSSDVTARLYKHLKGGK